MSFDFTDLNGNVQEGAIGYANHDLYRKTVCPGRCLDKMRR